MSGHSKWHQIRHKKSKEDAKRGQLFSKLSRAIMVAAREGGGNPETNPLLAAAVEKAKSFNMPSDSIERAIKRGTGEIEGAALEHAFYEGYGPGGVALMVSVLTDNRNRTSASIRHIFSRYGGNMGEAGCVEWIFEKKGHIIVNKESGVDEDTLLDIAAEAGAEDIIAQEDHWEVITDFHELVAVKKALEEKGIAVDAAEVTMLPKNVVRIEDKAEALKVLRLVDALEEDDDVQEVYANFDIPDEILEEIGKEAA